LNAGGRGDELMAKHWAKRFERWRGSGQEVMMWIIALILTPILGMIALLYIVIHPSWR
jgi:hypothetical protein